MAQDKLVSENKHLFYDPYIYGLDDDIFKVMSGDVKALNGKIRIRKDGGGSSAKVLSTEMMMFGNLRFSFTIPTVPTAGDSRIFGLYSERRYKSSIHCDTQQ